MSNLHAKLEDLATSFEANIDWSDGRNNYGDNEAYAECARQLRTLLAEHKDTLPYIDCGCGRTIYIPAPDPDTVRAQHSVARWALLDLANAMRTGALDYGPGNASVAVRAYADEHYPDTKGG